MNATFTWGLIGPGKIAHQFADAVHRLPGAQLGLVFGRERAKAEAFAMQWRRDGAQPRATADLQALLDDASLDGVYIATPHAQHAEFIAACLRAGKPVLCEKPLVAHLAEGQRLVALARERNVFLMEAVWTRFLPIYKTVQAWLQAGDIGPLRGIQSAFCFLAAYDAASRLYNPALAGGSLLDLGIYNLTMTQWVLQQAQGQCPEPNHIQASGRLAPTGVDHHVSAMLSFPSDIDAQFICGFDSCADNGLRIFGERGVIRVEQSFHSGIEAHLQHPGEAVQTVNAPLRLNGGNGFEGEIEEAQTCIRAGLIESPLISHADTLATLGWMDEIRRQVGVRYPFE
ncbi:MAG: Gfo/Idh/MocA family oxidoreductase [Burkholderiaceae bacterium]|nr:Gfo/Idh/MocA family oxidoreductase [Burkholderiaceae bacterium]